VETRAEVVVAGLGVMGAAVTRELARRGIDVVGIDALEPLHGQGSSHGLTRIIREAYYEDPLYVPLVQRAWELWEGLEESSGTALLRRTGCLHMGPPAGDLLAGVTRSVETHGLAHERLDARAIGARFPSLRPEPHFEGILEPRAGALFAERCVAALHEDARAHGARLHFGRALRDHRAAEDGLHIETSGGALRAQQLVLALGAWLPRFAPFPLTVERQCSFWLQPRQHPEHFAPERLPIVLWEHAPDRLTYAFPNLGDGVKACLHHQGSPCDPDSVRRETDARDEERLREPLARCLPDANGALLASRVCLYTNTPDAHFLIDTLPGEERVTVVSPCSGHGFKFAPAIGEVVADLCGGREPRFDIAPFRAARFAPPSASDTDT